MISASLAGTSTISPGDGPTTVRVASTGRLRGRRAGVRAFQIDVAVFETATGFGTGGPVTLQMRHGATVTGWILEPDVGYPGLNATLTIDGGTQRYLHAAGTFAVTLGLGEGRIPPPSQPFVTTNSGSISGTLTY